MRVKVVTVMRWYAHDEVNQEESEQNEVDGMKKGADSTGKVMQVWMSGWWFVIRKIRVVEQGWQEQHAKDGIQKEGTRILLLFANFRLYSRQE